MKERSQGRGIPASVVDLIIEYGTPQPQPDGTCKYVLRDQDKKAAASQLRQRLQHLEKAMGKEAVVAQNEVIAAYHRSD
ncbi:hypothetical protein [Salinibacter altiplanensis]|uniref:hypothetical protein n=1 Tax=Salinibacter altiplanensis TaxID=1803181 RepID=UPI001E5665FE|nr:hypothetical protein [Salinibacter altiplanensis]